MFKKLRTTLGICLIGAATMFAGASTPGFYAESMKKASERAQKAASEIVTLQAQQAQVAEISEKALPSRPYEELYKEATATAVEKYGNNSGLGEFKLCNDPLQVINSPAEATATLSAEAIVSKAPAVSKAGKISSDKYVAKDYSYRGEYRSAAMKLTAGENNGEYTMSNIYTLGEDVLLKMNIDLAAGTVTIPAQVIFTHETYGDVSFLPMTFNFDNNGNLTGMTYSKTGNVTGTIDENGVITLPGWGLLFTSNDKYKDQGYNFFINSTWNATNLVAKGKKVSNSELVDTEYSVYIEPIGENAARIFCLSGVNGDVLLARLGVDKTIKIAPQQIYQNLMYGPFFIYPTVTTDEGKVAVQSNGTLTGKVVSDTEIDFGGWVVAARMAPSMYVGYQFLDMKVIGAHNLKFPAAPSVSFSGEGTQASPYLIKTYQDLENMSKLIAAGNTYKGSYFELANDLDLSSVDRHNYLPIGDPTYNFEGNFDGKNHTISGLWVDGMGNNYTGIFGVIGMNGVVSNLKVKNARFYSLGEALGFIAGISYGKIDNCHVELCQAQSNGEELGGIAGMMAEMLINSETKTYAPSFITNCSVTKSTLTGIGSVGGIAGQARGTISDCSFEGNATQSGYISSVSHDVAGIVGAMVNGKIDKCHTAGFVQDTYGMSSAAGIVGRNISSHVSNCYNAAVVNATRLSADSDTYTAGIAGYSSDGSIKNCYNGGTILKTKASQYVGGILGYLAVGYSYSSNESKMINQTYIDNSFNYGQVLSVTPNPKKGIYGDTFETSSWAGPSPEDACITNSYYDASIQPASETKYGRPTSWFISGQLPQGYTASVWTAKAGKYPYLTQFGENALVSLATTPIVLRGTDTAAKVKVGFSVTPDSNIFWAIEDGDKIVTESDFLSFKDNQFTIKDQYITATILAATNDGAFAKMYQLALVPKLFDGEGTEESPYLLKTVNDWMTLNKAVSVYNQSHSGDYFAMANDIDFNYSADFTGVGTGYGKTTAGQFGGVLDGRNHSVHKLKIDACVYETTDGKTSLSGTKSISYTGLFGVLNSTSEVKNVIIDADCQMAHYSYGGGIAGATLGKVTNCKNYADMTSGQNYVGGMAGLAGDGSEIVGCYNTGNITGAVTTVGGIVGSTNNGALISRCQNDGDIKADVINPEITTGNHSTVGGIAGSNYANIDNCVNNGTITGTFNVGGIVGQASGSTGSSVISNCINNGFVNVTTSTTDRGGILGLPQNSATAKGCYYDASINVNGSIQNQATQTNTGLSTAAMTAGKAFEGLDASLYDFTAGSYPVLKAFAQEKSTQALRKIYVNFQDKQIRTNIQSDINLPAGIEFSLEKGTNFKVNNNALTLTDKGDLKVILDTISAKKDTYVKSFPISYIASILKGDGTAESPYLIESKKDWNDLSDFMVETGWEYEGNVIKIVNDIDFEGDSIRALAVNGTNFQAVLDGNNRTIKNYVYRNANQIKTRLEGPNHYIGRYIGVIGTLGSGGVVKDLTFDGSFIGNQNVAGIVGECYGTVQNVVNKGTVSNTSSNCLAGIVYRVQANGKVLDCTFEGKADAYGSYVGGIAYEVLADGLVENCINKGDLSVATSGQAGIAYYNDGMVRNCVNLGTFKSRNGTGGIVAGVVHTLRINGSLEKCHNDVDIDFGTNGGTICGVFVTATQHAVGHVSECYNKGALTGKDVVHGFAKDIKAGLVVTDCYNSGEIISNGYSSGFAWTIGESESAYKNFDGMTRVERCYNSGDVYGTKQKCSGLAGESRVAVISDCYNLGAIISENHTGLCQGGLVSQMSGTTMTRCFNAGEVTGSGNAIGGLAGYISSNSVMTYCYNIGNVTSTYEGTNTNGNAGGLFGYISIDPVTVTHCYNMGTVQSRRRVGGIAGGMFRSNIELHNLFNTGKVICLGKDPATYNGEPAELYFWSGTVFTGNPTYNGESYFAHSSNVYYDKTVNPGEQFRNFPNSGKTSQEMAQLEFGDQFTKHEKGGYPYLKFFSEAFDTEDIAHSMLLFTNAAENHEFVTDPITLVAPDKAVWTATDPATGAASTAIEIKDGVAIPKADGKVILTVADSKGIQKKDFILDLKPTMSSIDDQFADKTVESVTYIDINGRTVSTPVAGNIYIVRTVFTDGSMNVTKVIARD